MKSILSLAAWVLFTIPLLVMLQGCERNGTGNFLTHTDIGAPKLPGVAVFERSSQTYTIRGGGANMWDNRDAFHFLYSPCSGDLLLEADITWQSDGGDPHRKAGLMLRAGLAADAPYVDLVLHGDGLIAMQFRKTPGAKTEEIRAAASVLRTLRLERHGTVFSTHLVGSNGELHPVASFSLDLADTLLAGLAVCSHNDERTETALFKDVKLQMIPAPAGKERIVESTLEVYDLETGLRRVVQRQMDHFEAPNWQGDQLVINRHGRLYKIPVSGGSAELLDTGFADQCNNDHGFSADGQWLAISHYHHGASRIFVLPAAGGTPRLVSEHGPSYWHGWSPDGQQLVYCAERNGDYDVYAIPFAGGKETRLTTAPGLDDGPEFSPDGQFIYFNSVRSGVMKIWRMRPDGSQQEQVTFNEAYGDWFAHPSPDGKWLVFISYDKSVQGHPANQNVALRLMPATGGEPVVVATLFGGQGTMNVPNWSPDSKQFAFVSYRLVWPE